MPRVLLLLPSATYRAEDFLDAARTLGAEVVIGSEVAQTLAPTMGRRSLVVDLDDPERAAATIADHARLAPLDAVVAVDDRGVETAARASIALGLSHNPLHAVQATRDKAKLRAAFAAAGVSQPDWALVGEGEPVDAAVRAVGLPCVVKPRTLAASRGVIRADDLEGARAAAARTRAILACDGGPVAGPLLVERYVPGDEVALEGLLRNGHLEVLALFDKPDPLVGPFFEETIYITPSRLGAGRQARIAELAAQACSAIGLVEGPVHAEVRFEGDQQWCIEIAGRSIGGHCARVLRFGVGVRLEELLLRHALGWPIDDLRPQAGAAGVMMLPIPRAGRLEAVSGEERARAVPGIQGLEISIARGRVVEPLPEGDRYLGFLFAKGESADRVEASLRAAHAELELHIRPLPDEELLAAREPGADGDDDGDCEG